MAAGGPDDSSTHAEPTTVVGRNPDDLTQRVTLPDGALDAGCYVEGAETHTQTGLLQSWCVQWAEAGHGFCYVHPRGPEPFDLLRRLPEHRLDDVVWVDIDRRKNVRRYGLPPLTRVAIDQFDVPSSDGYRIDPVTLRVNAYLDAYAADSKFDWVTASVLQAVLPTLCSKDVQVTEVTRALRKAELDGALEPIERCLTGSAEPRSVFRTARARDPTAFVRAASMLGMPRDPYPENPLMLETTYDPANAIRNDDILLVTGAIPPAEGQLDGAPRPIGTRLLIAAICARLWEGAKTAAADTGLFPLVLEGLGDIATGEGDLYRQLLAKRADEPLAPVYSGPTTTALPDPLRYAIGDHVGTRLVVAGQPDAASHPGQPDESGHEISDALPTPSLDAVERYLQQEATGAVGEGTLCWLQTDAAGRLVGIDDLDQSMRPVRPPSMPETRHNPTVAAEAITASVRRHGAEPTYMDAEMKQRARERYRER
ncbi:hypothetical protein [Natronomonas amylolytica]|uniref:hypothetical protein n=1 Tax=Natronomonas amylolytica TaxID=3108498 RepID=UPI00300921FA